MKTKLKVIKEITISVLILAITTVSYSQNKDVLKKFKKDYGYNIFSHKQFFNNTDWAMCKLTIVYKLQSACSAFDNTTTFFGKEINTTKAGAYAVLEGVNEASLDSITNIVAQNFIKKMKDELNVNVVTWSAIKDNPETDAIKAAKIDNEVLIKKEGIALASNADGGLYYQHFGIYIPGGKKLAKSLKKQVMELTIFIDFAKFIIDATIETTKKEYAFSTEYTTNKTSKSQIIPVIHITPTPAGIPAGEMDNMGSVSDIKLGATGLVGHDNKGYLFTINFKAGNSFNLQHLESGIKYADDVVALKGNIPEALANRKNKLNDFNFMYVVKTTPDKYSEAVIDATNKFFNDIVAIYKASKP